MGAEQAWYTDAGMGAEQTWDTDAGIGAKQTWDTDEGMCAEQTWYMDAGMCAEQTWHTDAGMCTEQTWDTDMDADIKIHTDNPYYGITAHGTSQIGFWKPGKCPEKWKKRKRIRPMFSYSRKIGSKTDSQAAEMSRRINGISELDFKQ